MPPMTILAMSSFQYDRDHFSGDSMTPLMAVNRLPMIFRMSQVYIAWHPPAHPRHPYLSEPSRPPKTTFCWFRGPLSTRAPGKVEVQVRFDQRMIGHSPRAMPHSRASPTPGRCRENAAVGERCGDGSRVIISASAERQQGEWRAPEQAHRVPAMISPIPAETTPTVRETAPIHNKAMSRFGFCGSRPTTERKKPAGIKIAAYNTPLLSCSASAGTPSELVKILITRPRMTSTPAWACPARKNAFCKSLVGGFPACTRSMNVPP